MLLIILYYVGMLLIQTFVSIPVPFCFFLVFFLLIFISFDVFSFLIPKFRKKKSFFSVFPEGGGSAKRKARKMCVVLMFYCGLVVDCVVHSRWLDSYSNSVFFLPIQVIFVFFLCILLCQCIGALAFEHSP